MNNTITITVAGAPKTGKSHIINAIQKFLMDNDFDAISNEQFEPGTDVSTFAANTTIFIEEKIV